MLTKYLAPIYTHLKWVFDFVLYYPFYMLYDSHPPINLGTELSTFHYELTSGSEEHVDCAVCLSKFGEGERGSGTGTATSFIFFFLVLIIFKIN